ncbi:MAG TPA: DUF3043 domain-containing protein [Cellulomonas sp.]
MFGRSKDETTARAVEEYPAGKKDHPTPRRKESEAANKRPLVPDDRRQAAKDARAKDKTKRDVEYKAMLTGDEKHMPARDAGPIKRFIRDYVDSRFNLGAFFLPLAVVFLIFAFVMQYLGSAAFLMVTVVLYVYLIAVIIDSVVMWFGLKRTLTAKFGPSSTRGNLMYGVLRATQLPRTRLPRPQVKRGGVPVQPKEPKA